MKILKLQDFFNESFAGIMFMRQSFGCMRSVFITRSMANMENNITNS